MAYSKLLFNKQQLYKRYSPKACHKTICRSHSFGSASFQIIGNTYFLLEMQLRQSSRTVFVVIVSDVTAVG